MCISTQRTISELNWCSVNTYLCLHFHFRIELNCITHIWCQQPLSKSKNVFQEIWFTNKWNTHCSLNYTLCSKCTWWRHVNICKNGSYVIWTTTIRLHRTRWKVRLGQKMYELTYRASPFGAIGFRNWGEFINTCWPRKQKTDCTVVRVCKLGYTILFVINAFIVQD